MIANEPAIPTLATLPKHFRQIARWLVIVLTVGYSTGMVFVQHTTSLTPKGAEERYRGNQAQAAQDSTVRAADTSAGGSLLNDTSSANGESLLHGGPQAQTAPAAGPEPEMKFEKSLPEMLNITHTHILAMASFFAFAAIIFAMTTRPSARLKSLLIVEPFIAIITSFASMWLMRYVHPAFSYLLVLSSGSMALCFYVMMFYSFRELVSRPKTS
ncbi:MAG: hypothetical protein JWQ98_241 [Chlorobi bacterium]|nr:hypothetical protein [Chlorobiota bacterium]